MTKKICALSVFVLVVTVAAFGSWSEKLAVEVPFDFYVGDEAMPAGTYIIHSTAANGSVLSLENMKRGQQVMIATKPASQSTTGKSELIFNRYGESYFLAKVWNETSNTGRSLSVTPMQREMSKAEQSEAKQFALVIRR